MLFPSLGFSHFLKHIANIVRNQTKTCHDQPGFKTSKYNAINAVVFLVAVSLPILNKYPFIAFISDILLLVIFLLYSMHSRDKSIFDSYLISFFDDDTMLQRRIFIVNSFRLAHNLFNLNKFSLQFQRTLKGI